MSIKSIDKTIKFCFPIVIVEGIIEFWGKHFFDSNEKLFETVGENFVSIRFALCLLHKRRPVGCGRPFPDDLSQRKYQLESHAV